MWLLVLHLYATRGFHQAECNIKPEELFSCLCLWSACEWWLRMQLLPWTYPLTENHVQYIVSQWYTEISESFHGQTFWYDHEKSVQNTFCQWNYVTGTFKYRCTVQHNVKLTKLPDVLLQWLDTKHQFYHLAVVTQGIFEHFIWALHHLLFFAHVWNAILVAENNHTDTHKFAK